MTAIAEVHEQYGGIVTTRGGRRVVAHYGRPERTYRAVRNVAGVIEYGFGVVSVRGAWRRETVGKHFSNELSENAGTYGFLTTEGVIAADAYVFDVNDQLLVFTPGDRTDQVVEMVRGDGIVLDDVTRQFSIFGVHGPKATEKIASVFTESTPEAPLSIARGAIRDVGVTIVRDDGITGDEGYFVVATSEDAEAVFDALINHGLNGAPFGYETWNQLTLEAGTPLFETELVDATPATVGVRSAYPSGDCPTDSTRQLRGFTASRVPEEGAGVYADDEQVGTVTRAIESPTLETAIGFTIVDASAAWPLHIGQDRIEATSASLPFVDSSERSARIPAFE